MHKLGGYRVQGRDASVAQKMREDAQALQEAGADMLLLECVPASLAEEITKAVDVPVIGIGAGAACDGQVLVLYDMLGLMLLGKRPKFSRDFMQGQPTLQAAIEAYVLAVKSGSFPAAEHIFS